MDWLGVRQEVLYSFVIIFGTRETMTCQRASFLVFKAALAQIATKCPVSSIGGGSRESFVAFSSVEGQGADNNGLALGMPTSFAAYSNLGAIFEANTKPSPICKELVS